MGAQGGGASFLQGLGQCGGGEAAIIHQAQLQESLRARSLLQGHSSLLPAWQLGLLKLGGPWDLVQPAGSWWRWLVADTVFIKVEPGQASTQEAREAGRRPEGILWAFLWFGLAVWGMGIGLWGLEVPTAPAQDRGSGPNLFRQDRLGAGPGAGARGRGRVWPRTGPLLQGGQPEPLGLPVAAL